MPSLIRDSCAVQPGSMLSALLGHTPHFTTTQSKSMAGQLPSSSGMPLLHPTLPAPTAAGALPHRHPHILSVNIPFKAPSSPPPLACLRLRLRLAAPLHPPCSTGIPSRSSSRVAASDPGPSLESGCRGGSTRGSLVRIGEALSLGFPVWVASACALALWRPPAFLWIGPTAQMLGISFTMLGMGMTLILDDLKIALLMSKELAAGFILQYTISQAEMEKISMNKGCKHSSLAFCIVSKKYKE